MTVSTRGKFITLEGGEGAGKSTAKAFIAETLESKGIDLVETREPGGTELGEIVRNLLLSTELEPSVTTELLLIFASRAQHLSEVIEPALAAGKWVLCDRFTDATYAYQGYGRGYDLGDIAILERLVQGSRQPDLTFLFDLDPRIGLERAKKRDTLDRFEREQLDFFQRVRDGYLSRASNDSRFVVINAAQSVAQVRQQLTHSIGDWFDDRS
jgi:dTMP kinase